MGAVVPERAPVFSEHAVETRGGRQVASITVTRWMIEEVDHSRLGLDPRGRVTRPEDIRAIDGRRVAVAQDLAVRTSGDQRQERGQHRDSARCTHRPTPVRK